jgi:formate hydrogenlyase subunit 3/multisubunit Na+/H+ antiporter MnhD subunit
MTAVYAVAMAALAVGAIAALRWGRVGTALAAVGCILLSLVGIDAALGGASPVLHIGSWLGFGASALRADGLAGIFLALTGITGAAVSLAHVELPTSRYLAVLHCVLLFFVAVAIGSDNGFLFFLAWEALAVCIYLLASADRDDPLALFNGYLTAGLTKIGGAALLAAFGLLYGKTGSFMLSDWARHAGQLPAGTRDVLFVLFVIAFGTKVGVLPVQGALPAGYGAAPRTGAATLSVALAAGFYGLWRFVFVTIGPARAWWGDALLVLGALTAVTGITYALTQDDIRRFLGFSTVEHTGIALVGFGLALLGQSAGNRTLAAAGLLAATLHLVAHGLAKCLALIATDRVQEATGERRLDPLGGLGGRMGPTAAALGVASLTLAAIPPLGGFVSEWFTFEALLQSFRLDALLARVLCALAAATLALTAGLGLLAFAKLYGYMFLGAARSGAARLREPSRGTLSIVVLSGVILFLGTVAPWEVHLLGAGLQGALGFDPAAQTISHPLVLGPVFENFSVLAPTWLTIVLPAYVLVTALIARSLVGRPARRAPVWVTGSGAELTAVQYRPSSYSNPIRVVLRGPLGFRTSVREDSDGSLALETGVVDAIDRFVYAPLTRAALAASSVVRRLQSGRLSSYLLYMLAVLILVLVLVPTLH